MVLLGGVSWHGAARGCGVESAAPDPEELLGGKNSAEV